jgi:hypothetical protein
MGYLLGYCKTGTFPKICNIARMILLSLHTTIHLEVSLKSPQVKSSVLFWIPVNGIESTRLLRFGT